MLVAKCSCGARYKFKPEAAGRKARCKKCGEVFRIPMPPEPPPEDDTFDLASMAHVEAAAQAEQSAAGLAETASASIFSGLGGSSAIPASTPAKAPSTLPRIRPRTGFWKDVGWTLAFWMHPHNLVLYLIVLFLAGVAIAAVSVIPIIGLLIYLIVNLYVIAWYMSIIAETASGEEELPNIGFGSFWDETLIPALRYYGTFVVLSIPAFVYLFAAVGSLSQSGTSTMTAAQDPLALIEAAPSAMIPFLVLFALGMFLWPIALMCASMGGLGSLFRIDLIVIAVLKTFLPYVALYLLLMAAVVLPYVIVDLLGGGTTTPSLGNVLPFKIAGKAIGIYFSIVSMRLIGLYYLHFKDRFPWDWE